MRMPLRLNKLVCFPKQLPKAFGIVPHNGQPAAFFRTFERERRDDGMSSDGHAARQPFNVSSAVAVIGEEMKGGAIMPNVVTHVRLPNRGIRNDPMYPICTAS